MRIRITTPPTEVSIDGFPLDRFAVGRVYALPAPLATVMIVEGWAEPVLEAVDATLPPVRFDFMQPRRERRRRMYSATYLRTHLGIAADRRRRG